MNEPSVPEIRYHAQFRRKAWVTREGASVLIDAQHAEAHELPSGCDPAMSYRHESWDCTDYLKSLPDADRENILAAGSFTSRDQIEGCPTTPPSVEDWGGAYETKVTEVKGFWWTAVILDVTKHCNFGDDAKWVHKAGNIYAFRKGLCVHCAEVTPSYELWPAQGSIEMTDEAYETLSDVDKERVLDMECSIAPIEVAYHHVNYLDKMREESPHRFTDMFIEWDESCGKDPRHMEDNGYEGRVWEDLIHEVTNDIHL